MKVGTDAVLLGAWCDLADAKSILDIGTGSGIIALMMAQRSRRDALIDAVEILQNDAEQATQNVKDSPWPTKVSVTCGRIQDYTSDNGYDLIVCNPPFFSKSLLPPDSSRTTARHDMSLSQPDFLLSVLKLLRPSGTLSLILPPEESEVFRHEAAKMELHLKQLTRFHSRSGKSQERSLMSFTKVHGPLTEDTLILYEEGQKKTAAYQQLTSSFYLD